jgi:hypothetical protein
MKDTDLSRLKLIAIIGGVWAVPDVSVMPRSTLRRWQAYETQAGEVHLVGWCVEAFEGRTSSAVEAFDPKTRCCRTRSGRIYELEGEPGHHGDAEYVWNDWKRINAVTRVTVKTEDFALAIAQAAQARSIEGEGRQ